MKKMRLNVQGRVQGVGFRYMTKMVADELNITGSVRNEDNGSVTIEAVGDDLSMEQFIDKVKASPSPAGNVTHLKISEDSSLPDYTHFRVTH